MKAPASERDGAAVVIGVGQYLRDDQVWPLRYAARDAESMAGVLIDPEICGFPESNVKLLTDASATRDSVAHHLSKWLPAHCRGAQVAVIYFAGHGMIHKIGQREEGYLLPFDADPEDIVTRGLLMTDVARWIEAIDAATVIICLDCCHAAKVIPRAIASPEPAGRDMRIRPTMLQALTGRGRYLIASCEDGQVSLEAESWGHGLFTYHLLDGIRGAGDRDGDGRVGLTELFEHVAEAVERDARAMGRTQRPWSCTIGPGGVTLSTRPRTGPLAMPVAAAGKVDAFGVSPAEPATDQGAAPEVGVIARLETYRRSRDPAGIPEIFRGLCHESKNVREIAKMAMRALGWEKTSAAILALVRQGTTDQVRPVLEGLAAFESHRDVVTLLDRLVNLLTGDLRNQAILMLGRKRLVLDMEKTVAVFEAIKSPYRISRVLGQGLFTSAYAAQDEDDALNVVIRVLRPEFASQPAIRARFLDLSHQSRRFVHQNLVLTREVRAVPDHELYFVVRDHVDGVTLQSLIAGGTRFDESRIGQILSQIVAALLPLHRAGMVHGGIKPSNIFLTGSDQVVLGDPALPAPALGASPERLTYDYRYAAPELFQGSGLADPRADYYAIGCVAFEMICGHPPFVADNPFELAGMHMREPLVPTYLDSRVSSPTLRALVLKILEKSPAQRYSSTEQVAAALHSLAGERGATRQPAHEPESSHFTSACRHEEAVSIVSFNPATIAPSIGSSGRKLPAAPVSMPDRLGRYEVVKKLGAGGMGTVYLARDVELDRIVALKVIEGMRGLQGGEFRRFQIEARAAARLAHPGIVQIYDVGRQGGDLYLTLEYLAGGSLSQLIRRGSAMAPEAAARLVLRLAEAVQAAHDKGIIHRDLKPSNILLTEDGTPKISDFGLAKLTDQIQEEESEATAVGQMLGTPGYMSPEQVRGDLDSIGRATDVYGLGAILYECLTGQRPFQGKSYTVAYQIIEQPPAPPRAIRPEIPVALELICLKCLEKNPAKRYPGADQLARALTQFLDGESLAIPAGTEAAGSDPEHRDGHRNDPETVKRRGGSAQPGVWSRVAQWFTQR